MTVRLAIFDCDGTLIDGQASICEAMETAFAAFDLPAPNRAEVRRAVGLSLPMAVRRLLPDSDAELHHALADAYKQAFRAARAEGRISQPLFPGTLEVLEGLRAAGWLLGVATGMSDRGLTHCLATHDIADLFVTLQTADRHPSKPDPSMVSTALFEALIGVGVGFSTAPPPALVRPGASGAVGNPRWRFGLRGRGIGIGSCSKFSGDR